MGSQTLASVLKSVRNLGGAETSNGELLWEFVSRWVKGALAAILQRQGPMVLGLYRQVPRHEQEAEDVLQGTFLVLAKKAASVRQHEALAAWLHRVALNPVRTTKTRTAHRRSCERQAARVSQASLADEEALQRLSAAA
jgi:DNA-directed RNA polymerase specialized sigma24 family protein